MGMAPACVAEKANGPAQRYRIDFGERVPA
jgi:hypothetical protein